MTTTDTFAINVYHTLPSLMPYARRLWPNAADREDGMSECLVRALEHQSRFDGRNLPGWLTRILRNIKTNQFSKGYRKGTRPASVSDRIVYVDSYAAFDGIIASPWALGPTRYNKQNRKKPIHAQGVAA
jgi:DNA-directed RNA polymerase specialized sigma24 family protein